jgi:16S rRNA (uracil1498-N3)-methyltransferase
MKSHAYYMRSLQRKVINNERFDKIILAAMKQSNELYLPKLNEAISLKDFLKLKTRWATNRICEETDKKTLKSVLKPNENITILIGPEGDFSEKKSQWQLTVATFRSPR